MEDNFKSINKVTRTEEQAKAYNEPMYDSVSHVATKKINEVSQGKYSQTRTLVKCIMVLILDLTIIITLTPLALTIAMSLAWIMEGHSSVMVRIT